VTEAGGQCVSHAAIPEIDYHGVLVDLPANAVQITLRAIATNGDTKLLRSPDVKYFCSLGQIVLPRPVESQTDRFRSQPLPAGDPIVALLDGLPLENHFALRDRLIIDDPDGFSERYDAAEQRHGTAMASLIVHGELDANEDVLQRPVYIRPIMYPRDPDLDGKRLEWLPDDQLAIDLTHRALRRMLEGDGETPAVAPTIKAINLSVGDSSQLFDRELSPWARLLDWLAWKYRVLFVVSAGNHHADIVLDTVHTGVATLSDENLRSLLFKSLAKIGRAHV